MIVILGLVILIAAVIAGVAGVLSNGGNAHALTHFAVFGYHVTGSTGTLFVYGMVVGALALFGLSLVLAGARRTSRRGRAARQGLKQSRRETAAASQDRDNLIEQRDTARARADSTPDEYGAARNSSDPGHRAPGPFGRLFARRPAVRQPEAQADQAIAEAPAADAPAADVSARASAAAE